ncbi:Uncharacterized protein FVE85_7258 [Porphyridium purpureum]|uniref:FAS1 domain-containing protein n=1 Tax=Porphyridium purpureum TaxID=35688 RepID=A0A5J4ZA95_PORPP|nr:Chain 4H, LRC6 [Porphyridium purpureum]6KGX_bH Chain bH, LRC6 [Porphyridium purpureum]7EZX_4P Chain 4P, FAS1 domain-containing protein [Porphyridium purpureum]7EZX_bP Chain bP, FAS1 domain-containing protein [Porphyridium purpureum]7Y4L_43 Chain 43, FAS1 domain-containing protein [Porphyridium purpureum]7Y4L_b3 Chain b3, FAS1 domain-containing protein [Porphyridium purpureum]7Y5E_43 Chain 43, FAS1 domain-containing protein [Porphyridium purpureum]7Y5E_b3 Chain b3, FAS1 domain-containing p|eukprot:POR5765..scf295_1
MAGFVASTGAVLRKQQVDAAPVCERASSRARAVAPLSMARTAYPYTGSGYGSAGVPYGQDTYGYKATTAKSITETAAQAGVFNTFVKLLNESGVEKLVEQAGPYTVFAPTDDAFAALLEPHSFNKLATLLRPENNDALRKVLMHHVIPGAFTSASLMDRAVTVKSLAGEPISIMGLNKLVTAGTAKVVRADVPCANGCIIHAVSSVIIPPNYVPVPQPTKPVFPRSVIAEIAKLPTPRQALGLDPAPSKIVKY